MLYTRHGPSKHVPQQTILFKILTISDCLHGTKKTNADKGLYAVQTE